MLECKSICLIRGHEKTSPLPLTQSSSPFQASQGTPSLEWMFVGFGVLRQVASAPEVAVSGGPSSALT